MTFESARPMGLPGLQGAHELHRINGAIRRRRGVVVKSPAEPRTNYWDSDFYGLASTRAYRAASDVQKGAILQTCGRALLDEGQFIERAGVAFAAKMSLLAESMDERQTYALFAADEANHLARLQAFVLPAPEGVWRSNPFLCLLDEVITFGNRHVLQFVVQVVLEGWGLAHYRTMRDGCGEESLREVLTSILQDEAAHHGVGILLLDKVVLEPETEAQIVDIMRRFLDLVRLGPATVAGAVERWMGGLTREQRMHLLRDLNAVDHAATRLQQLEALMRKVPAACGVVARLRELKAFDPPTLEVPA